jgi:hypothetical protein
VGLSLDERGLEADIWLAAGPETRQLAHANVDELPSDITDDEYSSGAIGMFITPYVPREVPGEPGAKATVDFDNLRISAPAGD